MAWRRDSAGAALAAGFLALLSGCTSRDVPLGRVATSEVELPKSYKFVPADITVAAGTTVTWTNHDNFTHTIHLVDDGGAVLTLRPGERVSHTFATPGLHRYECSLHPRDMKGTVLVADKKSQGA